MNYANVVKSFFLGLGIGSVLQVVGGTPLEVGPWVVGILASGALGLLIGFITEWLTALLPIRIARTRTFFVLNNVIAISITTIVMMLMLLITDGETRSNWDVWPLIGLIVGIVCIANTVDYLLYARAQRRLRALQEHLASSDPA